jgi:hypothetical protein
MNCTTCKHSAYSHSTAFSCIVFYTMVGVDGSIRIKPCDCTLFLPGSSVEEDPKLDELLIVGVVQDPDWDI